MKRILYITLHNPWGRGGGASASGMYLNALISVFKDYIIDLCISELIPMTSIPTGIIENKKINLHRACERSIFSKVCSPISGITHRFQKIGKYLLEQNTFSYCIFDHSSIAGSLIKYVPTETKVIAIHHNYEPDYFSSNCTNPIIRHFLLSVVKNNEKRAYERSNINIFLTKEDLKQFQDHYGENKQSNIVTGLFETSTKNVYPVQNLKRDTPTIVISGSLNNVQNTVGITYFINELYPMIPANYKVIIAGQKPNETIKALIADKSNIELIADPDDMSEVVRKGNIFLSPANSGSGIKVRITDGLKLGLPVIAHEISARGYEEFIEHGYFMKFLSQEEFKSKLIELVSLIEYGIIKSENIVNLYSKACSFDVAVDRIRRAIL